MRMALIWTAFHYSTRRQGDIYKRIQNLGGVPTKSRLPWWVLRWDDVDEIVQTRKRSRAELDETGRRGKNVAKGRQRRKEDDVLTDTLYDIKEELNGTKEVS